MADSDAVLVDDLVEVVPVYGPNQLLQGEEHLFGHTALVAM